MGNFKQGQSLYSEEKGPGAGGKAHRILLGWFLWLEHSFNNVQDLGLRRTPSFLAPDLEYTLSLSAEFYSSFRLSLGVTSPERPLLSVQFPVIYSNNALYCFFLRQIIFFFFNFIATLFIYLFYFWLCWVFGSCEGFL